jgi:signal transduction histidine kinase
MSQNDSKGQAGENTVLGVGISGMRQRLLQLGGRLDIESSNNGTTVTAVLPFVEVALFRRQSSA